MILVGAEFLALVYLMVYVGALAVLFLFIIMMLNLKAEPLANHYNANLLFLALVPLASVSFLFCKSTYADHVSVAYTLYYA